MAQTKAQRSAAAKKAAATRKRKAAKRQEDQLKGSARQSVKRVSAAGKSVGKTADKAAKAAGKRAGAEVTRMNAERRPHARRS
jgi:hypothetical protein